MATDTPQPSGDTTKPMDRYAGLPMYADDDRTGVLNSSDNSECVSTSGNSSGTIVVTRVQSHKSLAVYQALVGSVPGGRNKAEPLSLKECGVVYMLDPENGAPIEETEWSERREQKLLGLPPHLVIYYHGISGKLTTPQDAQHVPLYGIDVAAWMYRSDTKEQKGAHLRAVHVNFPDGGERTFSIVKHRGGGPMLASQMAWMDGDNELYYGMGDVVGRADSSDNLNATGEFLVLGWLVGHACYNSPGDTKRWLRPEDRANPERGGKMRATAL